MIRPEVEKLRGMVFTPEELEDIILPLVATAKEKNFEKEFELGLSPNVSFQNDGHKCVIECEGHTYEFEFHQPVHHCIVLAETEKRLWKARILDTPKNKDSICLFQKEYYTDVREMSVKEAIEWYKDLKEHLNDFESVYDSDARGLYYKKDGEWVRYEEK